MLDAKCEMILSEYDENLENFQTLKKVVDNRLNSFVESLGLVVSSISSRIKTRKSLEGKLELKGYKYSSLSDITDILGCRVITFYNDDVDKFAAMIEKEFIIDRNNSIDKRKSFKVDQFGYLSLHYICKLPKDVYYDEKNPQINETYFEIQMRTVLQHAWASVYHDTGYKNDVEVPSDYLRQLNRLAGLLELADGEFVKIRNSLNDYKRNVKAVIGSGKYGDIEINLDSFTAFVDHGAFDPLNKRIAEINNMEIEEVPLNNFLPVLRDLKFETLEDLTKLISDNSEQAYQICLRQFGGTDLDIVSSSTAIQTLLVVYMIKNGGGAGGIKHVLNCIYGPRKANERYANRLFEIAKQMGMVE